MRYFIILLTFLIASNSIEAQNAYTQNHFNVRLSDPDIIYGIQRNFAGIDDTLLMDIYKPEGDTNCQRPLLILVHGGSWVAGSKNDPNIVFLAQEMARKGYVVAAINYRLGTHKTSNYSLYWACNTSISAPCAYIADSSEIVRAIYRGMQDTKGAVRFMKERSSIDSTDINNVFLAGESAGGFNVLAAAFLQNEMYKPDDCFLIPDAESPDADLISCLPSGYSLDRPDLGSVEGDLHTGSMNSSIKGVANFYGGMLDPTWIETATEKPAMYLFHQGSDVVVDYNYNRVMGRINWECFAPTNVCQPYGDVPFAYGSEGLRRYLDSLGSPAPLYAADIVYNYNYMNDCFANGHSIDNLSLRALNMATLFSVVIDSSGNIPPMPCSLISVQELNAENIIVYPNPAKNKLYVQHPSSILINKIVLRDVSGRTIATLDARGSNNSIDIPTDLSAGIYFIEIKCQDGVIIKKMILQQ